MGVEAEVGAVSAKSNTLQGRMIGQSIFMSISWKKLTTCLVGRNKLI
jgi:hypothetical protein